jgi:glutathionyl-hydroquinone reductase
MKKYKVKLIILDDKDEEKISSITDSEIIKHMKNIYNTSALDQQLEALLTELKKTIKKK